MHAKIVKPIVISLLLFGAFAHASDAAEQKLGFAVDVEGEGFFLNPIVRKLKVTEVTKGSIAEAAGVRTGDQIIEIDGQKIDGMRALALRPFMKLNPGETRTLRLKHADGSEADARITKPKA